LEEEIKYGIATNSAHLNYLPLHKVVERSTHGKAFRILVIIGELIGCSSINEDGISPDRQQTEKYHEGSLFRDIEIMEPWVSYYQDLVEFNLEKKNSILVRRIPGCIILEWIRILQPWILPSSMKAAG
jgi:hypothetical protein